MYIYIYIYTYAGRSNCFCSVCITRRTHMPFGCTQGLGAEYFCARERKRDKKGERMKEKEKEREGGKKGASAREGVSV